MTTTTHSTHPTTATTANGKTRKRSARKPASAAAKRKASARKEQVVAGATAETATDSAVEAMEELRTAALGNPELFDSLLADPMFVTEMEDAVVSAMLRAGQAKEEAETPAEAEAAVEQTSRLHKLRDSIFLIGGAAKRKAVDASESAKAHATKLAEKTAGFRAEVRESWGAAMSILRQMLSMAPALVAIGVVGTGIGYVVGLIVNKVIAMFQRASRIYRYVGKPAGYIAQYV